MIKYWNRRTRCEEIEKVYGDTALQVLYGNSLGRGISQHFLTKPWLSRLYGLYQSSTLSRPKIKNFIHDFKIPMEEFEEKRFGSFNDFFIRRFKPGMRTFTPLPSEMPAFAEGRYYGFKSIFENALLPVKGFRLSPAQLLGSEEKAKPFLKGPCLIARLCPTDYHRFHFPDEGTLLESYRLSGRLHSVNPLALAKRPDILMTNERQVSLLKTKNFGLLAYVEVGALCVGKIVQTHSLKDFNRGGEKGYFLFGASSIVLLGQAGGWLPDEDILKQTAQGRETLILLGKRIATTNG